MTFFESVSSRFPRLSSSNSVKQSLNFFRKERPSLPAEEPSSPVEETEQHAAEREMGRMFSRRRSLDERLSGPRPKNPKRHRTLFISDTHLGTPGCKADLLLDFLRHNEAETLYLIGDIIDGWRIKRSWYWNAAHNAVIQEILRKARKGTTVIYVPGNHDEALRDYTGVSLGGVDVVSEALHETADGRQFLILHGDQFDSVVRYAKWLAHLGDYAYTLALAANNWLHEVRRLLGMPYWSLSSYLKHTVKNAVEYISSYETAVARYARERQVNGVICGHIHHAEIRDIDGIIYCNDGDWVESCTAIVEDKNGALEIVVWQRFSWDVNPSENEPSSKLLTAA